jgi:hypothetical protein
MLVETFVLSLKRETTTTTTTTIIIITKFKIRTNIEFSEMKQTSHIASAYMNSEINNFFLITTIASDTIKFFKNKLFFMCRNKGRFICLKNLIVTCYIKKKST